MITMQIPERKAAKFMEKPHSTAAGDCPKCGPIISLVRFLPLFVFAGLVLLGKLDLLIAAPLATFYLPCHQLEDFRRR